MGGHNKGHMQTLTEAITKLQDRIDFKENGCHIVSETATGKNPWITFDGVMHIAARAVWMYHFGPIQDGMVVCHHCDNPRCVNIDHLFLGTQKDNMQDCKNKGRNHLQSYTGEDHPRARLTEEQVRIIRSEPRTYGYRIRLAKRFGVTEYAIDQARAGKNWKHVK